MQSKYLPVRVMPTTKYLTIVSAFAEMETSWLGSFLVLVTGKELSLWPWDNGFGISDNNVLSCVAIRNSPYYLNLSLLQHPKLRLSQYYLCRPQAVEHWHGMDTHGKMRSPKIIPRLLQCKSIFWVLCRE